MKNTDDERGMLQLHDAFEAPIIRAESGYCPCGCGKLVETVAPRMECAECGFDRILTIKQGGA